MPRQDKKKNNRLRQDNGSFQRKAPVLTPTEQHRLDAQSCSANIVLEKDAATINISDQPESRRSNSSSSSPPTDDHEEVRDAAVAEGDKFGDRYGVADDAAATTNNTATGRLAVSDDSSGVICGLSHSGSSSSSVADGRSLSAADESARASGTSSDGGVVEGHCSGNATPLRDRVGEKTDMVSADGLLSEGAAEKPNVGGKTTIDTGIRKSARGSRYTGSFVKAPREYNWMARRRPAGGPGRGKKRVLPGEVGRTCLERLRHKGTKKGRRLRKESIRLLDEARALEERRADLTETYRKAHDKLEKAVGSGGWSSVVEDPTTMLMEARLARISHIALGVKAFVALELQNGVSETAHSKTISSIIGVKSKTLRRWVEDFCEDDKFVVRERHQQQHKKRRQLSPSIGGEKFREAGEGERD